MEDGGEGWTEQAVLAVPTLLLILLAAHAWQPVQQELDAANAPGQWEALPALLQARHGSGAKEATAILASMTGLQWLPAVYGSQDWLQSGVIVAVSPGLQECAAHSEQVGQS